MGEVDTKAAAALETAMTAIAARRCIWALH